MSKLIDGRVARGRLARDGGRQLRWLEAGESENPPVLLVAGAGEVGLDFATVLPQLAEQGRVLAYDRAGLGASDRVSRLTLTSQVDDLTALLDVVGPAVLVGHSWGGLLAELAARARPELVAGLVLIDPYDPSFSAGVPWHLRVASELQLNAIVVLKVVGLFPRIAAGMGRALAEKCTADPDVQVALVDAYVSSYGTVGQVAMIGAENRLAERATGDIRRARSGAELPDVPLRILTAGRGKPPLLQRLAADLAEHVAAGVPRGEHVAVPDSGHYLHHDQPAAVVSAVDAVRPGALPGEDRRLDL